MTSDWKRHKFLCYTIIRNKMSFISGITLLADAGYRHNILHFRCHFIGKMGISIFKIFIWGSTTAPNVNFEHSYPHAAVYCRIYGGKSCFVALLMCHFKNKFLTVLYIKQYTCLPPQMTILSTVICYLYVRHPDKSV